MSLEILAGLAGMLFGAVGAYVALRKDRREQRASEAEIAAENIRLLEEQNGLLERQIEDMREQARAREAEWRKREEELRADRERLEKRIGELEKWQRDMIHTITAMRYCRRADTCLDYDPGKEASI